MHIICHVSVVVLSGLFVQYALRDNPTAIVEKWGGVTIKSSKSPDTNVYISSWAKQKHNELKSVSFPNAQSLFSMTESDSDGNAEKKQKGQWNLSLSHASSALFIKNN